MTEQPRYVSGNIFVELGLVNLPEEQKLALLDQMNELIHKRAMLQVIETLTDEQKERFMSQNGASEEEIMRSLQEVVPNLGEIVLEQVEQVKNEVKASVLADSAAE